MKKAFLISILTISGLLPLFAVEKGDVVLQPALNLGAYGPFNRYSNGSWGGAMLNTDFAVHDYVSVGPYLGFNSGNGFTSIGVGARGVFHWWQLIDDRGSGRLRSDEIDFYLPFYVGFRKVRTNEGSIIETKDDFFPGIGIGFRYYFNENIGIAFEFGGLEMSSAKLGVAIKL